MATDELLVLDEDSPRSLEVPPKAVRPGRGGLHAGIGLAAVAVFVIAVGLASRSTERSRTTADRAEVSAVPGPVVLDRGPHPAFGWSTASVFDRPLEVIDLTSPGVGTIAVTSNRLTVAGSMLVRAARVEIVLVANGNRLFGQTGADVSDPDGGLRPDNTPRFEVRFDLAAPRPRGTLLVVVTAYDEAGDVIGDVRRAISFARPGDS